MATCLTCSKLEATCFFTKLAQVSKVRYKVTYTYLVVLGKARFLSGSLRFHVTLAKVYLTGNY